MSVCAKISTVENRLSFDFEKNSQNLLFDSEQTEPRRLLWIMSRWSKRAKRKAVGEAHHSTLADILPFAFDLCLVRILPLSKFLISR